MPDKNELQDVLENHTDLYDELMKLFNNDEKQALKWLTHPKVPLCNVTPLSLIADSEGKGKVMDMLYRIKTGDIS
jgi:uncharacterized protein (DUF2384 family)